MGVSYQPTRMPGAATPAGGGAAPTVIPTRIVATVEQASAPAPAISTTRLPGETRVALQVTPAQLATKFPGETEALLQQAATHLATLVPAAMRAADWLQVGVPAQQAANVVLNERLALVDDAIPRQVCVHLARLQTLLAELVESVQRPGLFQRKSLRARWQAAWPEIDRLRQVLEESIPHLSGRLSQLDALAHRAAAHGQALAAWALALAWLESSADCAEKDLALQRQVAVQHAAAMLQEQRMWLEAEFKQVTALIARLSDGVLLQLPAIHGLLASLPDNPDETQKFMAVEKLSAIQSFLTGG